MNLIDRQTTKSRCFIKQQQSIGDSAVGKMKEIPAMRTRYVFSLPSSCQNGRREWKKLKRKKVLESRSGDLEEKIWPIHHAVACFFLFPHYNSFAPFVGRLDVVSTHLFPHSSHRSCRKREWLSSRRRGNSSPALSVSRVDDSVAFPNVCHRGGCQARRFFPPLAKVRTGIVRRDAIIR